MSEDSPTRLDRRTERREVFAVIDASPVYKLYDIDHVYTVVTSHSLGRGTAVICVTSASTLLGGKISRTHACVTRGENIR